MITNLLKSDVTVTNISQFYPQHRWQKPAGIDMEQNYVAVTPWTAISQHCFNGEPMLAKSAPVFSIIFFLCCFQIFESSLIKLQNSETVIN